MNLTPQQKATAKRTGKRISFFNEQGGPQPPQPLEVPYYSLGTQVQEPTQSDGETLSGSEAPRYLSSVIFSPEKGDRARGHYQQTVPMKWGIPEQGNANWPQGGVPGVWGQNYSVYVGNNLDMNIPGYGSQVYSKLGQEPQQQPKRGQEKQTQNPAAEAYRETAQSRNVEWEQQQQQALARQQAQIQAFRHGQKQGAAPPQPAVVLQPFQLAFGQQKQQLPPGYFQQQQQQLTSQSLGSQSHQQGPPGQFQQSSLNPELQMYLGGSQQTELAAHHHPQPRRSRRLSKESAPPAAAFQEEQPGNLFLIPWSKPAPGSQASSTAAAVAQNGALEAKVATKTEDATGALTGVIQSTRRKRRVSQEVNLHTLAQKASEMESIPPPAVKVQHIRINIGHRYQAEIPELRERLQAQQDEHKADLVWKPLQELETKQSHQDTMRSLMSLACSSALCGGGTNQELALHCLHESKGDILGALALLLLKKPIFQKNHPLADYHYAGSDKWTSSEKWNFNNGISAYRKDFFLVQKLVRTKTVVQCVEFYYTYKKQVKIGRNGTLIFGDSDVLDGRDTQDDAEINVKSSQRYGPTSRETPRQEEEVNSKQWEDPANSMQDSTLARVSLTLPANENASEVLVMRSQEVLSMEKKKEPPPRTRLPPPPPKPLADPPPTDKRKTGAINQVLDQDSIFPCKKCGRNRTEQK
ncbi:UNVERIFIED_CONTAM: hypothetical protein FKN15_056765 [Acipenser sinensis]